MSINAQPTLGTINVTTILEHKALEEVSSIIQTALRLVEEGKLSSQFFTQAADQVTEVIDATMRGECSATDLDGFIVDFVFEPTRDRIMWDAEEAIQWVVLAGLARPIVRAIEKFQPDAADRIGNVLEEMHRSRYLDKKEVHPGYHQILTQVQTSYDALTKPFYVTQGKKWSEEK